MRIAIVNDTTNAVEAMRNIITHAAGHRIAWIARDGNEAVHRCAKDRPDLVLMDLFMPLMDGVEATRRIMAQSPCAIVVVTASIEHHISKVFEAMGAGALDAVNTPVLEPNDKSRSARALLQKIDTIKKLVGESTPIRQPSNGSRAHAHATHPVILIGASAGGPAALAGILSKLPADFPAPIVIVQHVDAQFAPGLADWLDHQTSLRVRIAQESDLPKAGVALLAGTDHHLVFTPTGRVGYVREPVQCSYHPSIDVLFKSACRHARGKVIGVLLTGMGRDGAEGLKLLREQGHHTVVQDQSTSAVYGMPKAATEINAALEILPLERIAARLIRLANQKEHAA